MEERYKTGDKIRLTYNKFEKPQIIETTISEINPSIPHGIKFPLGSKGHIAYYMLSYFDEDLRIENNEEGVELVVRRDGPVKNL